MPVARLVALFAAIVVLAVGQGPLSSVRAADSGPRTPPVRSLESAVASGRIQKETLEAVRKAGNAPVVVRLVLPNAFRPEGSIPSLADQQRAQIATLQDKVLQQLARFRFDKVKRFKTIPHMALEVSEPALSELVAMPEVAIIHPDRELALSLGTSVPLVGGDDVRNAIGINATGAGQTIAILDSGVDQNHEFLLGRVVSEACYSSDSGTLDATCPGGDEDSTSSGSGTQCAFAGCDHGTHVAGIAAGNGTGVLNSPPAGVAPAARIISIKVASRQSSSTWCMTNTGGPAPCPSNRSSDVIRGLERVYDLRTQYSIAAVNLSLGIGSFTNQTTCDDQNSDFKDIIDNLRSRKIATVIASGNGANTNGVFTLGIGTPACISSAISVGRTQGGGATAESVFSTSQTATFLDVLAPGTGIQSSITGANSTFGVKGGTSMAAPHVAGAFAVLRSLVGSQSVDTYLNAITSTGLPILDNRGTLAITTPRLQLGAAAESLIGKPLAPSGLTTGAIAGRSIQITWSDTAATETLFKVQYRPRFAFGWADYGNVAANTTTATVGGLRNFSEYDFQVLACNGGTCSAPSNTASGRTLDKIPDAPSLQAGTVTWQSAQVTWSRNSNNTVGCNLRIEGPSTNGSWTTWTSSHGSSSTGTAFTPPVYGATYHFYLAACGVDGDCSPETHLEVPIPVPPGTPSGLRIDSRTVTNPPSGPKDNFALSWITNAANVVSWDLEWYHASAWQLVPEVPKTRLRIASTDTCCWTTYPSPPPNGIRVHYTLQIPLSGGTGVVMNIKARGIDNTGAIRQWSPDVWYTYP